ncbi:MAG: hypothetical protein AAGG11_21740 [Pseudomonadota bacterium]
MDGRHARRERGQRAVIDAVFELIQEGDLSPSVEAVGARAGVSVATIFRNYGSLDELGRQLMLRFRERFGSLFLIPELGEGALDQRIGRYCDARLDLYEAIWPFVRFMTMRAPRQPEAAANLDRLRDVLGNQVRRHFKAELSVCGQAESQDLATVIDALTAPESWSLMQVNGSRSRRQIKRAWTSALSSLLGDQA